MFAFTHYYICTFVGDKLSFIESVQRGNIPRVLLRLKDVRSIFPDAVIMTATMYSTMLVNQEFSFT